MILDDKFIYVFIRQNMFPDHQMVHTFHLGLLIGQALDGLCQKRDSVIGHPSVILVGVPDAQALVDADQELERLEIERIRWADPDSEEGHDDYGTVGIVTVPITKAQRNKLNKYRPWSDRNNVHPHGPLANRA